MAATILESGTSGSGETIARIALVTRRKVDTHALAATHTYSCSSLSIFLPVPSFDVIQLALNTISTSEGLPCRPRRNTWLCSSASTTGSRLPGVSHYLVARRKSANSSRCQSKLAVHPSSESGFCQPCMAMHTESLSACS